MIKNLPSARILGVLGIGFTSLTGCLPEDDLSDLHIKAPSPSVSLPLLNTNLAITDIITIDDKEGRLTENEDHSYRILYQSEVQTKPVGEFFPKIPSQSHSESFALVGNSSFSGDSYTQKFRGTMPLDMGELTIYSWENKQGELALSLYSDQYVEKVKITFPQIISIEQREPLVWEQTTASYQSTNELLHQASLADYEVVLDQGNISYEMEVTVKNSTQSGADNHQLTLDVAMTDIEFAYLSGNFSGISVPIEADTLAIPILAHAVGGTVALNPTLRMNFANSYGIRIRSDFSRVFVDRKNGSSVRLEDENEHVFFDGEYPLPFVTQRDEAAATQLQVIDESTSNIKTAFAELPRGLRYDLGFTLHSAPEDTSFVTDQSQIKVNADVELPLEGTFDLILQDSIPVNFADLEDVESMKILIKTENSFPLEARLKVSFLDEDGQVITNERGEVLSLFEDEEKFLAAATLLNSKDGKTKPEAIDLPLVATIDAEKFQHVRQATHLLVRTELESISDNDNQIRLYSFYNIRFNLATQIKTSLD